MSTDDNKEKEIVAKANEVVISYFSERNIDVEITGYEFVPKHVASHVIIDGRVKGDPGKTFSLYVDYNSFQITIKMTDGFTLPDDEPN